ncbi:MAG: zinc-dependent metalloprotease [Candidatus Krumholzibacteriia bacterium]
MKRLLVFILALALLSPGVAVAGKSKRAKKEEAKTAEGAAEQEEEKKGPLKDFDEVTDDTEHLEGFFDFYQKPGQVLLAIPEDRLGEDFLMSFEIAEGIGRGWLIGGTMLNWEGLLVSFERHGNHIYLVQKPHRFKATDSRDEGTVDFAFGSSVIESAEIQTIREKDKAVLIDVYKWFTSDISGVGEVVRFTVSNSPGRPGRAQLDPGRSYLESVKVFPRNVNIRSKLTFKPGDPVHFDSVPDSRYLPLSIFCVMTGLPERPMEPRLGDDRVGYFLTAHKDYSREEKTFFQRYVRRWRLERGKKRGDLHSPKKPIVFYLDRNIPAEFRPYVKAGVEEWNLAFETAGFKNAIQADLLPKEADAEDIRYPTIRWVATDAPSYGAIGPSVVDPRTGEVLDADVLFDASLVLRARATWRDLVDPALAVERMFDVATGTPGFGFEHAGFGEQLAMQMALVRTDLIARGEIAPEDPVPVEFVGEFLKFVTMHEVGHTLGLRHNFRGSIDTPIGKLHDRLWTGENGVVNSVMEYPAPNIAPNGKPNGHYYTPTVGTYDRWAIAYGYAPEPETARELARRVAQAGHAYGTDEDARGSSALDPTVNVWDLGEDPLAWSKERCQLVKELWRRLPEQVLLDDRPHYELTNSLLTLMITYAQSLVPAVKYIGGQYVNRDHVGDPDARAPFVGVPKAKQQEALEHLLANGFGEKSFEVPRAVLAQLGPNRWSHWGQSNTIMGRVDYPLHEIVLSVQRVLLDRVTDPIRFARIADSEAKFGARNVLTMPELMDGLTSSIWSEVWSGQARNVPSMRRNLQRLYVDRMTEILANPPSRMPADARSVARMQLRELRKHVSRAMGSGAGLDAYTRAHLGEVSERIDRALEAGLDVEMLGSDS